jgi:hypothetical protein
VFRQDDMTRNQPCALAFEQAPLEAAKGFAHRDSTACRHNAVPRNALATGASSHGVAGGASSARQPRGAGELSVSNYAALWHALHERIELVPGRGHNLKIPAKIASCQFSGPTIKNGQEE